MKTRTWYMLAAVAMTTALPLWLAGAGAAFGGADDAARQAVGAIAPGYRPWFAPVFEPASPEIASLLFALQAAAGAGVIGFWLGLSVARERARRAAGPLKECRAD